MKYKALIFDFDGTAVKNAQFERPTPRVVEAVMKAKERVIVCGATGRPLSTARWIFDDLQLTAPCIISAGTKIVNPVTEEVLWQIPLSKEKVSQILDITKKYDFETVTDSQFATFPAQPWSGIQEECVIYLCEVPIQKSDQIISELKTVPDISLHFVKGYNEGTIYIHITHKNGSKEHAITMLKEMINVKTEEIIGVGDSFNDVSLFQAVGLKVAMGNGADNLKAMAEYVAPSVDDDGLAEVIEKFILNN